MDATVRYGYRARYTVHEECKYEWNETQRYSEGDTPQLGVVLEHVWQRLESEIRKHRFA